MAVGKEASSAYSVVYSGAVTRHLLEGLSEDTTFRFRVRSNGGEFGVGGATSVAVAVTPPDPEKVTQLVGIF
jgi:hypothetical protein